ncbi:MAG: hypothetical protein GY847_30160 [Proteobacteria bacterium]|nr:hypothetical protein [Pseudomonadota bacterium]
MNGVSRWIILAILTAVLADSWGDEALAQYIDPGPLSKPHAELDTKDQCFKCHISGRRTVPDRLCGKCHKDVWNLKRKGKGLHGKKYKNKKCSTCHTEHYGRSYQLTEWPKGDKERFPHDITGWPLNDAHKKTKCKKCHKLVNERGAETFLGLKSRCLSCHKDPHESRLGNDCLKCHNENKWKEVDHKKLDHDKTRYKLEGKHKKVKCEKCHGKPAKYLGLKFSACADCHTKDKDPHKGRFSVDCVSCHNVKDWKPAKMKRRLHTKLSILGGHKKVKCKKCHDIKPSKAPSKGRACVACHKKKIHKADFGNNCLQCHKQIQWVGVSEAVSKKAHAKTVYPLNGKHGDVKCDKCHKPEWPLEKRYKGLKFTRCLDCHKDSHKSEFVRFDGGECKKCHNVAGFRPALFGREQHVSTKMPLNGRHQAVACNQCHQNHNKSKSKERLDWRLNKQKCSQCHKNPHGNSFDKQLQTGDCAICHKDTGWKPAKFKHDKWPLLDKHASVLCLDCHVAPSDDQKTTQLVGPSGPNPRECDECHKDIHAGQFGLTKPVYKCDKCHDAKSFKIPKFDHQKLTDYPLEGKHKKVKCAKCHPTETLTDGTKSIRYRLPYDKCRDCHADPHVER